MWKKEIVRELASTGKKLVAFRRKGSSNSNNLMDANKEEESSLLLLDSQVSLTREFASKIREPHDKMQLLLFAKDLRQIAKSSSADQATTTTSKDLVMEAVYNLLAFVKDAYIRHNKDNNNMYSDK